MTKDGVALGRMLFYDPILSADSTMSCSSFHLPEHGFTDNLAVSIGVAEEAGSRSSMSLTNAAYLTNGLFWDGRRNTLEGQALDPVTDPLELLDDWDNVEKKLRRHADYPAQFRKAFGIESKLEITRELATQALAQFERILISGNSKFDKHRKGELFLDDSELNGMIMFFDSGQQLGIDLPDAECAHCHNEPLLTNNDYFNNGLDVAEVPEDFVDPGRGEVTSKVSDYGRFRAPTLRNIALTAPYMHDGRFETLEEVIEHYNSGGHPSYNKDPLIRPLNLTEEQKQDLLNFLKALTDEEFINNPEYKNPFEG